MNDDGYCAGIDLQTLAIERAVHDLERELHPFNAVQRVNVIVILDQLARDCEWHRNARDPWC